MDNWEIKHLAVFIIFGIMAAVIFVLVFMKADTIEEYLLLGSGVAFIVLGIVFVTGRWIWISPGDEHLDKNTLMKRGKIFGLVFLCSGVVCILIFITGTPFYYVCIPIMIQPLVLYLYRYFEDNKIDKTAMV